MVERVDNIYLVHAEKLFLEKLKASMSSDYFTLVEEFNQKLGEYARALIAEQEKISNLKSYLNNRAARKQIKSFEKNFRTLFSDHFNGNTKVNTDIYISAMFQYFLQASNHYESFLKEYTQCQPSIINKQLEAIQKTKAMFINSLTYAIANGDLHKSTIFSYISHAITQLAEVVKDDEVSGRNSLKCYHPNQVIHQSISKEEIFNTTIKKLKPHVKATYSFFKSQIETGNNPLVAGQMLYYIDIISKVYQGYNRATHPMIRLDAKAKVFACTLATVIIKEHFKYFENHLIYPISPSVAIEDFKNGRPYSPKAQNIRPIGLTKSEKHGIYAKPKIKVILAEKETTLNGK